MLNGSVYKSSEAVYSHTNIKRYIEMLKYHSLDDAQYSGGDNFS